MSHIILFKDTGELGNRLVTYSFLLSFAREYYVPITNLCFWRYARYFDYPKSLIERPWLDEALIKTQISEQVDNFVGKFTEYSLKCLNLRKVLKNFSFDNALLCKPTELTFRVLNALICKLNLLLGHKTTKLGSYSIIEQNIWGHDSAFLISRHLCKAILFQLELVEKHSEYLRQRFQPSKEIKFEVNKFLNPIKKQFDVLVGVHIRRGDYKLYRDGAWYFSDEIFIEVMKEIEFLFKGKKVGFVIASNEQICLENFASVSAFKSPGQFMTDMYTLANCNMIIGPPSTFSGWASFIGKTPIAFLTGHSKKALAMTDFDVWKPRYF